MRAMLVSFAAYYVWLHWREPWPFLALAHAKDVMYGPPGPVYCSDACRQRKSHPKSPP